MKTKEQHRRLLVEIVETLPVARSKNEMQEFHKQGVVYAIKYQNGHTEQINIGLYSKEIDAIPVPCNEAGCMDVVHSGRYIDIVTPEGVNFALSYREWHNLTEHGIKEDRIEEIEKMLCESLARQKPY